MYNKTVWKTGDIIPADKMNNIENGIETNDLAITDIKKELVKTVKTSEKGVANGIATLDENGKVSSEQLPESQTGDFIPNSEKGVTVATLEDGELVGTQVPNNIKSHIVNEENPHNVTADQIGLTPIDGLSGSNVQAVLQAISLLIKSNDVDLASLERLFTADGANLVGLQPVNGVSASNLQQAIISLADTISKVDPYLGNPVAISQGGTDSRTTQEAIYKLGCMPRENLLPNWRFKINQRGKKQYTDYAYSIDGAFFNGNGTVDIHDDYVDITATSDIAILEFKLENPNQYKGKKLTFALLAQRIAGTGSCYITSIANEYSGEAYANDDLDIISFTKTKAEDITNLTYAIVVAQGNTLRIYAGKFEVGDFQTLGFKDNNGNIHIFEEFDYAKELAKCERYLLDITPNIKFNASYTAVCTEAGALYTTIPLPVPMRITPTLLAETDSFQIALSDGSFPVPESVSIVTIGGNYIALRFIVSSAQIGQVADIRLIDETKKWLLSAEL